MNISKHGNIQTTHLLNKKKKNTEKLIKILYRYNYNI